jgi:hypothetical protein
MFLRERPRIVGIAGGVMIGVALYQGYRGLSYPVIQGRTRMLTFIDREAPSSSFAVR